MPDDTEAVDDLDFDECLIQVTELAGVVNSLLKSLVEGKGIPGELLEEASAALTGLADEVGYKRQSCLDPEEIYPTCKGVGSVDPQDAEAAAEAILKREGLM